VKRALPRTFLCLLCLMPALLSCEKQSKETPAAKTTPLVSPSPTASPSPSVSPSPPATIPSPSPAVYEARLTLTWVPAGSRYYVCWFADAGAAPNAEYLVEYVAGPPAIDDEAVKEGRLGADSKAQGTFRVSAPGEFQFRLAVEYQSVEKEATKSVVVGDAKDSGACPQKPA
jgi:hypothetical protein